MPRAARTSGTWVPRCPSASKIKPQDAFSIAPTYQTSCRSPKRRHGPRSARNAIVRGRRVGRRARTAPHRDLRRGDSRLEATRRTLRRVADRLAVPDDRRRTFSPRAGSRSSRSRAAPCGDTRRTRRDDTRPLHAVTRCAIDGRAPRCGRLALIPNHPSQASQVRRYRCVSSRFWDA